MSWLKKLFGKTPTEASGIKPLRTKKLGWKPTAKKSRFRLKFALTMKGQPLRVFEAEAMAFNRLQAEKIAQEDVGLKLISITKLRKK